ncbi:eCIS core domain-containing protein [Natronobiforma cellulositropha]|uniref:eCIS core domain-containing protein n=1 Tax=Natronobiforma cellulositropha TaxID=1679076 RepID=UPI0021D5DC32|nr:DUF4157 domain-containing protein [Natronobiforma cellulositropha]
MSFDRDRRDRSNDDSERNERTRRARVQAQTQRGARPYQYLNRVGQPSREQAAILDQMILRRGLENVQELGERGELPEGCNTPMGEQVRVARVRSSWKAGVELDTPSAMRSVEAQTESDLAGETATPDVVRRVISQPGRPLEGSVREEMEARMGDSFSDVQLHTGPEAVKAASALEARAFTTGNHVVFNRGEYDPESPDGKYLLAHELAHVRQQTGGAISMLPQEGSSLVIDPDPELEREADEVARKALEGEEPVVAHRLGMKVQVQRMAASSDEFTADEDQGVLAAKLDALEQSLSQRIDTTQDQTRQNDERLTSVRQELTTKIEQTATSVTDTQNRLRSVEESVHSSTGEKALGVGAGLTATTATAATAAATSDHVQGAMVDGHAAVEALGPVGELMMQYPEVAAPSAVALMGAALVAKPVEAGVKSLPKALEGGKNLFGKATEFLTGRDDDEEAQGNAEQTGDNDRKF